MIVFKILYTSIIALMIGVVSLNKGYCSLNTNPDTSKINSLLKDSKIAFDANEISKSLSLANAAIKQSANTDYKKGITKSLFLIGQIQSINGKKDSSLISFHRARAILNGDDDELEIATIYNSIGKVHSQIGDQDSAEIYYNKALKIRQKLNDKSGIVGTLSNLGVVFYYRGMYTKALEYYFQTLTLLDEINDPVAQSNTLNNIGGVFWNQGDYSKALEFFSKSLKIKEDIKDIKGAAAIYNNIGIVYRQMEDYNLALKNYNISIDYCKSINDSTGMSLSLMGIGDIYQIKGEHAKALDSYMKSEILRKKESNVIGLANLYVSMGMLYRDMGDYRKSLDKLEDAQSIYLLHKEPWGNAKALIQSAVTYSFLGESQKAISSCNLGIAEAKQIGAIDLVKEGYNSLSNIYERIGNISQAFSNYKLFITFRDSITNLEKTKQLFKVQIQSEFDKVLQKQKVEQEGKLYLAQNKSIKQTKIANIFILAFVITLSILVFFFINFRQKQKNNDILAFQKLDMERQRSELMNQRDELEIQKNLVIHQRDKIMTMLTDLGESIDYARKIQQALLPSDHILENTLGDYFLLFQPRESVGGDFYWVYKDDNITFFAIADCTGHGVPGGFMSMLGVSLLNEIVTRSDCKTPSKMLWSLRDMIIKALSQTGLDDDSQDGMDIALCMYNSENRHLVYSGANLSLMLSTNKVYEPGDKIIVQDKIVEFKGDRMPVAFYMRMEDYNEHHLDLNPGDTLYMFSDGYADQFGGPSNKKFGYTTFRNLIAKAATKPFEKQRDIFWNEFDKWKGDENQTDDVIVMGVRIS